MILGHSPKGMDIHDLVPIDESLQNAMKKYTKRLDDQFKKRVGRKGEGGYLTIVSCTTKNHRMFLWNSKCYTFEFLPVTIYLLLVTMYFFYSARFFLLIFL